MKRKVNRLLSFLLALAMVLTSFSGMSLTALADEAVSYQWTETSLSEVGTDCDVIIAMSTGNGLYAVPSVAATNANITAVKVDLSEEKLVLGEKNEADLTWRVVPSEDKSTFVFTKDGKYLSTGTTDKKYNSRVNGTACAWALRDGYLAFDYTKEEKTGEGEEQTTVQTPLTRYLGVYQSQDFRAYLNTDGNIKNQSFHIYKKTEVSVAAPTQCADVTASVPAGEVDKNASVELICATEGSEIFYNTDGSDNFSKYESPITITKDTTITAFAQKTGLEDSAKSSFTYTVKKAPAGERLSLEQVLSGEEFVLSFTGDNSILVNTANKTKLGGIAGSLSDDKKLVYKKDASDDTKADTIAKLVVGKADNSESYLISTVKDDKVLYLTSGATGNSLSLEENATEYSLWNFVAQDKDDTFLIVNANAAYKKNEVVYSQAIEYYNGFTTYNYLEGTTKKDYYTLNAYTYPEALEYVEPEKPASENKVGKLLTRDFYDKDQIAIVYVADKCALTKEANGKKLTGVEVAPADDNTVDFTDKAAEILTVSVVEGGMYQFTNADGKYLTSGATGSALTFEDAASDYSLWTTKASENGQGYYLINANAKYGTSAQYLEYYKGFTTYSYKSASETAYVFNFYCVKAGTKSVLCDKSIEETIAQFAGNANYDEAGVSTVIKGDLYETNDMLDNNAEYTAVVGGKNVKAYTSAKSTTTGSTSYYMGATGVGSGKDDYLQLKYSSLGYGNMKLSFRLRSSNTGVGELQAQYSTDGTTFENFADGTYAYAYTSYSKDGTSSDVKKDGSITNGIVKPSLAPTYYVSFTLDVPSAASNAETLYIRLVPVAGAMNAKGDKAPTTGGVIRVDSIVVTGNPVVDDSVVGFVTADPVAGEVALGSELTLTTKTEGATIYYSVDGEEAKAYDATNKPVLSKLPAKVSTYAVKEGLTKSITRRFAYTQAQCANIKATPNGGAINSQSKVAFKCATEDAKILFSYEENGEFEEYTSPFSPKSLPCDIYVKATKDGYLDSAVSKLSFTAKTNDKYGIYFGQIHAHTNYSDGAGTCEEAFQHASKVANLDFIAITDHSNSLDNAADSIISKNVDKSETDEWTAGHKLAEKYSTDKFACVYGYEMTWSNGLGHMNTFNTPGFQSRTQTAYATYSTALQNYYAALNTVPDSISQFNHPGTTFGDFSDFSYYTEANDSLITMIEVGNGEGTIGSSGYFPSYEYYTRALDKGWHVAPTNNQDNHKSKWGDANTARTVMLSDTNDEAGIYDAMRNYRLYATEDNDLSIYYTLDSYVMGTILEQDAVGDKIELSVELKDPTDSKLGKVEVIVNGGLSIAKENVETNEETVKFTVPSNYSYYYIKVTEADGDIAVTAPVWVGEVEACGINKTYTNSALAVQKKNLDVNVDLYNNEKSELKINNIKVTLQNSENVVTEIYNKTGAEAGVESVASNSTATFTLNHLYESAGKVTYEVTVDATLNGVAKTYTDKLSVDYVVPQMVTKVIVDASHYNDYVSGYYGGNVTNLVNIAADKSIDVQVKKDKITAEDLADCALLVVSAPAKKNGTANAGDYTISHFEDSFLTLVADYVKAGGSVIVCGMADYSDSVDSQTATEQNKLLAAIGSTIRMNSDEVYDDVNNGGQAYRLYPTSFDMSSPFMAGVVNGQQYSQYSGCSVDVSGAKDANDFVSEAHSLVKGFETTYSINCKNLGVSAGNTANDNKGDVTFFAQQSTKAGGNIFVAGGVFCSDFEVKAEMDNNDSLPYVNYTLINNILSDVTVELETSTIAEARAGETGEVFAVEGYVTSGTTNPDTTFFDTIYIQDETAGIDIFPYAETGLANGTFVRIIGFVSSYQGDKELKVISSKILSDVKPNVIEPTLVDTKTATDYDKLGGSLLRTEGIVTRVQIDNGELTEFWIKDKTGVEAAIFIDGYIKSGTTGKNVLADFVKVGKVASAAGVLYMHPEGDSDVSVPVFRVRDCDDIAVLNTKPTASMISTIAEVRKANANTVVAVEGYVTGFSTARINDAYEIYIQDETAGIAILCKSKEGLEIGKKVNVVGSLINTSGGVAITVINTEILSNEESKEIEPKDLDSEESSDQELSTGSLVSLESKVIKAEVKEKMLVAFYLKDKSGKEIRVSTENLSEADKLALAKTVKKKAQVKTIGISTLSITEESTVYGILPRTGSDITITKAAPAQIGAVEVAQNGVATVVNTIKANPVVNAVTNAVNRIFRRTPVTTTATITDETTANDASVEAAPTEESVEAADSQTVESVEAAGDITDIADADTPLAAEKKEVFPVVPVVLFSAIIVLGVAFTIASKKRSNGKK